MNVQSILGVKGADVATVNQSRVARRRRRPAAATAASARSSSSDDGDHIDGIVSERDIVRALAAHGASALGRTVGSVMSTDVVTCAATTPSRR